MFDDCVYVGCGFSLAMFFFMCSKILCVTVVYNITRHAVGDFEKIVYYNNNVFLVRTKCVDSE